MNEVVIKILQGSVLTQIVLGRLNMYLPVANLLSCILKMWTLVGSRQHYCNNKKLTFWPPCVFLPYISETIQVALCMRRY